MNTGLSTLIPGVHLLLPPARVSSLSKDKDPKLRSISISLCENLFNRGAISKQRFLLFLREFLSDPDPAIRSLALTMGLFYERSSFLNDALFLLTKGSDDCSIAQEALLAAGGNRVLKSILPLLPRPGASPKKYQAPLLALAYKLGWKKSKLHLERFFDDPGTRLILIKSLCFEKSGQISSIANNFPGELIKIANSKNFHHTESLWLTLEVIAWSGNKSIIPLLNSLASQPERLAWKNGLPFLSYFAFIGNKRISQNL